MESAGSPLLRSVQDGSDAQRSRSPQRARPKRGLPTDRMHFDRQVEVLRTFGRLSGANKRPVDSSDVAGVMGVTAATAGLSTRFFVEAGWLEQPQKGKYAATDALLEYTRSPRDDESSECEAATWLAETVVNSWSWAALKPLLVNRRSVPKRDAQMVLIREAGAEQGHKGQIDNLLAWLDFAGLITVDQDTVALAPEGHENGEAGSGVNAPEEAENDQPPAPEREEGQATGRNAVSGPTTGQQAGEQPVVLSFHFSVQMTAADLACLDAEQIRAVYEGVGSVAAITAQKK